MRKLFLTALLLLAPVIASADPWCLVRDALENCRYMTAEDCYTQANTKGGYCKPNAREIGVVGRAPYCVITEGRRECSYRNKGRCLIRARQVNGGCVRNTEEDLRRGAAGEKRIAECQSGDIDCDSSGGDFGGAGLESLGYGEGSF